MLWSCGFSQVEDIELPEVGSNQAVLFKATHTALLDKYLGLDQVRAVRAQESAKPLQESPSIHFPTAYIKELANVSSGRNEQAKFHRIAARLIATIFDYQLKNPVIEYEINGATGRIDIKFQNRNKPGFFKDIKEMRNILCPSIFVECKNYSGALDNPEYAQLSDRLSDQRGMFGFLICRNISNRSLR